MEFDRTQENDWKSRRLITSVEAAEYLDISERHLWTITHRGDLPAIKLGRSKRYSQADLDAYIDRRRQDGRSGSEAA